MWNTRPFEILLTLGEGDHKLSENQQPGRKITNRIWTSSCIVDLNNYFSELLFHIKHLAHGKDNHPYKEVTR